MQRLECCGTSKCMCKYYTINCCNRKHSNGNFQNLKIERVSGNVSNFEDCGNFHCFCGRGKCICNILSAMDHAMNMHEIRLSANIKEFE